MAKSLIQLMLVACMFIACTRAKLILDPALRGIDILHEDNKNVHKADAASHALGSRALGSIRHNLGRQICGEYSQNAGGKIIQEWKLSNAYCKNDKDFHVTCRQSIPNNGNLKEDDDKCGPTETCGTETYTNIWGQVRTDVFCEANNEDREDSWSTTSSDTDRTICGPGITNTNKLGSIPEADEKLSISIQFYGSSNAGKRRTNVGKAWLQSNKAGILGHISEAVNGLFWRGVLKPTETIQPCIIRTSTNDATVGYEDWTEL